MFALGGSSSDDSSSERTTIQRPPIEKKQTSSSKVVAARTINEELSEDDDVFESDDEVDDIDESAIVDDDSDDDWEDTNEASGQATPVFDETWLQRTDSRRKLTSHKSLLTIQLAASRSTPAFDQSNRSSTVGPTVVSSPDSEDNFPLVMEGKAIAIAPRQTNSQPVQALSPRTTRRNMLAAEFTVSLRQHLLWERHQKSRTANAVLKRRHTAQDVADLKQYPEKVCMKEENTGALNACWNEFFDAGVGEYNSKGW